MVTRRSRWSGRATLAAAVGIVVVVALDAVRATPAARTDARPNVVVVLVDDMGWSDIGPYGGEIPTPNLDALAGRGVRFTQFYSTPRCSPTRASLLTGLYPHQAGMGHLDNVIRPRSSGTTGRLNDRSVTIAEVLREAGYFTAMSGKWHLGQDNGSPPWQRGFDRVLSLRAGGMYFPNQNFRGGGDALTARAREPLYLDGTPTPRDAAVFGDNWYATYLWTDFGLRFIDEARKANKPFFLYLPYNAPHFPLMAPAEVIARHRGRYKAGWDRLREARYRRQIAMGLIDGRWPLSPRDPASPAWESLTDDAKDRFDHLMAVYAAMIEAIDTSIGRLVKELEARGALDNTLILFLSDNGANAETGPDGRFNGDPPGGPNSNLYLGMNWATLGSTPFRRFKHFTHEGGIAVPLIAHWPRGIPARRRNALVREPAHLVDVMPTILEVAGAAYPREFRGQAIQAMEGVSLRPALAGRALARTQPLFWEHEGNRAVRSGKWKLVSAYPKAWELYDMTADRVERNDLAASRPDLVRTLATAWDAWAARADVDPWTGPPRLPWGDDAPPASAVQEVGARRTGSDVTSPEVAADRRVTFRLRAPEAKAVKVSGDFGADADMQRSDDGVWTVTVGPLDPETYVYFFTVDGVPADRPQQPAGEDRLRHHDDEQPAHRARRQAGVLRRAGRASRRDPDAALQVAIERRDARADGLRAAGLRPDAKPALSGPLPAARVRERSAFVAPLRPGERHPRQPARATGDRALPRGHAAGLRRRARQRGWTGIAPPGADGPRGDPALYQRDLLEDIIPMIDGTYRTIADRRHRAIIGFSMGGGQAGRFGLRHLQTFSHVGVMSAGLGGGGSATAPGSGSDRIAGGGPGEDEQADRSAVDRVRQG